MKKCIECIECIDEFLSFYKKLFSYIDFIKNSFIEQDDLFKSDSIIFFENIIVLTLNKNLLLKTYNDIVGEYDYDYDYNKIKTKYTDIFNLVCFLEENYNPTIARLHHQIKKELEVK